MIIKLWQVWLWWKIVTEHKMEMNWQLHVLFQLFAYITIRVQVQYYLYWSSVLLQISLQKRNKIKIITWKENNYITRVSGKYFHITNKVINN